MFINIAGLTIAVSGVSETLQQGNDPAYHPFFQAKVSDSIASNPDISLTVSIGSVRVPDAPRPFFETNESWKIARDHEFFYYTHQPPLSDKALWTAQINRFFSDVHLVVDKDYFYCGAPERQPGITDYAGYPLSQILLMHHMALHTKGLLIHSAGMVLQDNGYIFPGKSGAGKSTLSRQLEGLEDFELLSDDRMIVRKKDNVFYAYGTPWPGEAGVAVNKGVPLTGLFFIHHADENRVETLAPKTAVERLMPVSSIPWYDREAVINLLDFCDDLTRSVPAYDLYFKPTTELADFLRTLHFPESYD